MILSVFLLLIPSLVWAQNKELLGSTKWLCDHHFHPTQNRMIEFMVKMENCCREVNQEKATKMSQCIPFQAKSMSESLMMCDDKQKYESVYNQWRECLKANLFTSEEHEQIKKCVFGEGENRPKRNPFLMDIMRHDTFDKFCEKKIEKYFLNHPELKEVGNSCMKKMYPEAWNKRESCDKILNLGKIDVLKEVCEGKRENELNQKQNCEKELQLSEEEHKKIFECTREELTTRDWDRAARLVGLTPQKTFNDFCAIAWAAPWGNMSEHHRIWMRVDMNEARVNLETYIKRHNCHSINLNLACKHPDQYTEEFKKMVECEQMHKFTPEEMEKIKSNLLAEGIDPVSAQLEVTHGSDLMEFCSTHRRIVVMHDHDFSQEAMECADEFQPGISAKVAECRKFCEGQVLREMCKDRAKYEAQYQEAVNCIEAVKPDSETVTKIMECAAKKLESKIPSEEVEGSDESGPE